MGKSMQDQLIALGIAGKSAAESKLRPERRRPPQPKREPRQQAGPEAGKSTPDQQLPEPDLSLAQAYRLRKKLEEEQAVRARRRKHLEDRRRRQLNQNIRAIVETHRLNDPAAEFPRNFMHKGRIRKVIVTAEQLKALNEGALGLVYLAGGYHILRPDYVEQVNKLSPEHVPDLTSVADDDEEHPVPDDLIW